MNTYLNHKKTRGKLEKEGTQRNPIKFKNVFQHCKMSENREENCYGIHIELHPTHCTTNQREWRVNISDEEIPTSTTQGL